MTQTEEIQKVEVGQLYVTSWGYDQTNYDFLIIENISPSGKTAICRKAKVTGPSNDSMGHDLTPVTEGWGNTFRMRIEKRSVDKPFGGQIRLRGSYPYCQSQDDTRLGTFSQVKPGRVYYSTGYA